MPDDVEGKPFPDGWEPDDDRGGADEDFASVVFDEAFVKAAAFHEPSAVERLLAAAQARADAEAARPRPGKHPPGHAPHGRSSLRPPHGHDFDGGYDGAFPAPYGRHGGALRPYRNSSRWHRPVAWLLALLMGIGLVVFAFAAVYRGASGNRDGQVPSPAATGVDTPASGPRRGAESDAGGSGPSASAQYTAPTSSARPSIP
ncbi:hypothetical protein ACQPZG_23640 [Streptomyces sp. CA-294286]|uniref:SCO2584 family spore wall biosynthesis protein n=1 Tax=Streptomyces sp. CA-294286 TaxID=3240070 RepID=UPI003D8BC8BF